MSWQGRILDAADGLGQRVERLFAQQIEAWPLLGAGVEGLARARSRELTVGGAPLTAWHIPHRIASTSARVDRESIGARRCFLCPENLPAEERALEFGPGFLVACNPYPIRERHLSIVSRDHRPQLIADDFPELLGLAEALPGYLVLYNGAACGASAPDHLHFQACRRDGVPVLGRLGTVEAGVVPGFPAPALVLRGSDPERVARSFAELLDLLASASPGGAEPLLNVVAVHGDACWEVVVFPRRAHRPRVYHSGELTWSPGALDMAGVIVLPVEGDLERVTPRQIEEGFREVCPEPMAVVSLARRLGLS